MSVEEIQKYARELAAKAYTHRAGEYPEEISSEMEQANVKQSLEDLSIFIGQCTKAGKKVVLSIEFGIRRFANFRFNQITNVLLKEGFAQYDEDVLFVILGIDADFDNRTMLRTMEELTEGALSARYKLVNKQSLEQDSRRFQVTPLPGEEIDVSKGNANLYFFEVEKKQEDLILRNDEEESIERNNIKQTMNEPRKKLSFYTYFIKHHINTSYFKDCDEAVLYHKAQQSESIKRFSRNSVPTLPFWKGLQNICRMSLYRIYYANFAHFESNGQGYLGGIYKKGLVYEQLRLNKFSERMSEIWNILLDVGATPVFLIDLDLVSNKTFETAVSHTVERLTDELMFKKQDETIRMAISRDRFDSQDDFTSVLSRNPPRYPATPVVIESIDWDSVCPDPPEEEEELVNGGGKRRKTKKRSNKTKSRGKKRGTRKGK